MHSLPADKGVSDPVAADMTADMSDGAVHGQAANPAAPGGGEPPFRNRLIAVGQLPQVAEMAFEPLDDRYLRQQHTLWSVFFVLVAAAVVVAIIVAGGPWWAAAPVIGVAAALIAVVWTLETLAFRYRGVQLRQHDFSTRRGLIARRTITVPFTRVQHVAVERGPVDRVFGLSTVVIYTAGAQGADAKVDGLDPERADRLRETLVSRSAEATERQ